MKRIVFGLLFSVVASVAAGQCRLEPAEDIAQSSPSACKTYYDNVFALLFGGFSEKPEARYASLPSFTEEYAFSLEKDKKGYRIVSTTLTANYRYATRRKSVKAQVSKKHISESMAVSLRELFRLLIRQIEEPSPDEARRGSDGTTYFFASTDNEGKTAVGETWSPEPASALGRLVGICNDPLAVGNRSTGVRHDRTEEELLGRIRTLTSDLSGNE